MSSQGGVRGVADEGHVLFLETKRKISSHILTFLSPAPIAVHNSRSGTGPASQAKSGWLPRFFEHKVGL